MNRVIFSILFCVFAFGVNCPARALSVVDGGDDDIKVLKAQHDALVKSQDSLQNLLNIGRGEFKGADMETRKVISEDIIRYEGEMFEIKSQLSQVNIKISAIQSELASESLDKIEQENLVDQDENLVDNAFIKNSLSAAQLKTLKNYSAKESKTISAIHSIKPFYNKLKELHIGYESTRSQSELDSLLHTANNLIAKIQRIESTAGGAWAEEYNDLLYIYTILLDKAPDTDRTLLESIELEAREVRRQESFMQRNSFTPNLSVFDIQRKHLHSYQMAVAKAASLDLAYKTLESVKITPIDPDFKVIEFLPRVLVLYSPVDLEFDYPYTEVDDVPEMILPERGVYYTVQIALMNHKADEVAFFKGVGPIQVQTLSDSGKWRYCVAGFNNYEQAVEAVAILKKKGLRAPTLISYLDGEVTTAAKARAKESEEPNVGSFKVVLRSAQENISEIVRQTKDMHAKDKSVIRLAHGDEFEFTISEFTSKAEADVFAQILRSKVSDSNVEVQQITTNIN